MATIEVPDFEVPSWLSSQDSATIQQRMMNNLPDGIDRTEGGFPWDLTKPTALEKAELLQFHLTEAMKQVHPFWATYTWLDLIALQLRLKRKSSSKAAGTVQITGVPGTVIPAGYVLATAATTSAASKLYETDEMLELDENGEGEVGVTAITSGVDGNTGENTVILMYAPMDGITSITNEDVITGGADQETDDELRQRVIAAERNGSVAGCDADYIRWSLEVPGVGTAEVDPTYESRGTVRLIIGDMYGGTANQELLDRVYAYIISPDDRSQRLAPIGATLLVDTVEYYNIDILYDFTAADGADETGIEIAFEAAVEAYFDGDARSDAAVSYNRIRAFLEGAEGVLAMTVLNVTAEDEGETDSLEPAGILELPLGKIPRIGSIARAGE